MRRFTNFPEIAFGSARRLAAWLIPVAFYVATAGSLAIGLAVPAILGSDNPWGDRPSLNTAAGATRGDEDYVQGLTQGRGNRHSAGAPVASGRTDKDAVLYCALADVPDRSEALSTLKIADPSTSDQRPRIGPTGGTPPEEDIAW